MMEDGLLWNNMATGHGQAVRSTVEDCVREMVTDVELAGQLRERLALDHEIKHLKAALVERDYAAAERKALSEQQASRNTQLADALVSELWTLSQRMGELHEIKQNHQELLVKYDEAIAKLLQAEDALEQAKREQKQPNNAADRDDAIRATTSEDSGLQSMASAPSQDDQKLAAPPIEQPVTGEENNVATIAQIPESAGPVATASQEDKASDSKPEATVPIAQDVPPTSETPSQVQPQAPVEQQEQQQQQQQVEQPEATVAVVSLEHDTDAETPTLSSLETKILMNIFGYLDALDILNTAQINISMYSRVDSLFGLGAEGASAETDNSTIATVETAPSQTSSYPAATTTTAASTAASTATSIAPTVTTTAPPTPVATATGTVAVIPGSTSAPTKPVAQAQPQEQTQHARSASNDGIRGIFNSMLQPRKPLQQSSVAAAPRTPVRKRSNSSVGGPAEPAPMNAAMANSMAAKLTDQELNAIILMTERLRQKEQLVEKLVQERDALLAKLDGTESVKQFLVEKVRDMEQTLQAVEDNESKVAQQIASDQEVIAFLDSRIRELERQTAEQLAANKKAAGELARVREQAEQKGMVMGDMLQYERERWSESELSWKATRKVLVKEVKSCRAQIITLQAERDGYREQNDALRKAVLSSATSPSHK